MQEIAALKAEMAEKQETSKRLIQQAAEKKNKADEEKEAALKAERAAAQERELTLQAKLEDLQKQLRASSAGVQVFKVHFQQAQEIVAKMLAAAGRVLYVSREEGFSVSFQNTVARLGMADCGAAFQVIDNESVETLTERLSKPKSPEFVIIDSVQVMGLSYQAFRGLKERFPRKLFVLVSQVDGKQPDGRGAKKMMYDADLKLWVEGHTVFSKGRFIGRTGTFVIWLSSEMPPSA